MSKRIDISLDDIIQNSRKQTDYKKFVKPKFNDYKEKNYSNYDKFDINRQNLNKKRIVFNSRSYKNNNNTNKYDKKSERRQNDNDDCSEEKEIRSLERFKKPEKNERHYFEKDSHQPRQKRKIPERIKVSLHY